MEIIEITRIKNEYAQLINFGWTHAQCIEKVAFHFNIAPEQVEFAVAEDLVQFAE